MDEDVKLAYEKLGLPEGASREEVEKRYELLLRRSKSYRGNSGEESDFAEVNRAYKSIVAYEDQKAVATITEQQYGKYKRYAKQAEKVDYFFNYYKWHLIGVIAAIGLVIYGIIAYIDHREEQARLAALPPIDLQASFIGLFYLQEGQNNTDLLEAAMLESFPEWKRIEADLQTLNMARPDQMDLAIQQKIVMQLATENPDIYVLDSETFQWIARNRVLKELDAEVQGRLAGLLPEGAARSATVQTDIGQNSAQEEHVYGISVGDSPLAKSLPIAMKDMIIGIRVNSERSDKALELIETYLQAQKQ